MKPYRAAKRRVEVSVGGVRARHPGPAGTQPESARPAPQDAQATISAIENDRVRLGVERAKVLARALKCHPAVLVFPGWDSTETSVA